MSDIDRPQSRNEEAQASPRTSFSFVGGHIGSVNTSSSVSPSTSSSSSSSTKTAVSECLSSWLNYLQLLNSLCAAGFKLSQSLSTLAHCTPDQSAIQTPLGTSGGSLGAPMTANVSGSVHFGTEGSSGGIPAGVFASGPPPLLPALTGWDELARSTAVATATVKCHIVALLQEYSSIPQHQHLQAETTAEQFGAMRDNNYQIIADNISTLVNLQYQFCVACFECLSLTDMCQCSSGEYQHQGMADSSINERDRMLHSYDNQHPGMSIHESIRGPGGYHETPPPFRGPSPVEHPRGPSPISGFIDTMRGAHLEHMRGPLPNPGLLQGMKAPFHGGGGVGSASKGLRSPLHFPLFPLLQGQRRWSEAAAAEASTAAGSEDASMRRWSMPWDSAHISSPHTRYHHYYPTHYHHVISHGTGGHYPQHQQQMGTRNTLGTIAGGSKLNVPLGTAIGGGGSGTTTSCSDRSRSTTPDSIWQPSGGSQDGLAEAIQLLSCRPGVRPYNPGSHPSHHLYSYAVNHPQTFIQPSEPYHHQQETGHMPYLYSMWSGHEKSGLPFIRLPDMPEQQTVPDKNDAKVYHNTPSNNNIQKPP